MKKIFILLIILFFIGCGGEDESLFDSSYDDSPSYYAIKYEVTGTASTVDITYENRDGGTSQISDRYLPWEYTFTGKSGDFVYVSAQNQGSSGTVTVTIYDGDRILDTSTSSGAYVIATASDML